MKCHIGKIWWYTQDFHIERIFLIIPRQDFEGEMR